MKIALLVTGTDTAWGSAAPAADIGVSGIARGPDSEDWAPAYITQSGRERQAQPRWNPPFSRGIPPGIPAWTGERTAGGLSLARCVAVGWPAGLAEDEALSLPRALPGVGV
jgi:hypothetical protein